jgi:hypothetical protein
VFKKIADTLDGVACYWGKKNSNEPESSDLSLWVTLGEPKSDGSNYCRVPPDCEIEKFKKDIFGDAWDRYIADIIAKTPSETIMAAWRNSQR